MRKYKMSVISRKKDASWVVVHYHDTHELYYSLKGAVKYFIEDQIYKIEEGTFVFVPKGISHKTDSDVVVHNERMLICFDDVNFDPKMLKIIQDFSNERVFRIRNDKYGEIMQLLKKIEYEYLEKSNEKKDSMIRSCLIEIYIQELLVLLYCYKIPYKENISYSEKNMMSIAEYISENYDKPISLKSISEDYAFNASYLSRRFRAVTRMSVNEYITHIRLSNAKLLLRDTNNSINKVAILTGFNDSNYFSTVFKKNIGISPLEFRNKSKQY